MVSNNSLGLGSAFGVVMVQFWPKMSDLSVIKVTESHTPGIKVSHQFWCLMVILVAFQGSLSTAQGIWMVLHLIEACATS